MSQQLQRAAVVLRAMASARSDVSIREIAEGADLPKSAVQRLLSALVETGMVVQNHGTRRYSLGPLTLALGTAYRQRIDLRSTALPHMVGLRDQTGETVGLSVPIGQEVVHVEQVESSSALRRTFQLGVPLPLWCGAPSRLVLADRSDEDVRRLAHEPRSAGIVPAAAPEPAALISAVARSRQEGYAVAFGETIAGVNTIAVPVRGSGGQLEAMISITGPAVRWDEPAMMASLDALSEVGREVGIQLGHH